MAIKYYGYYLKGNRFAIVQRDTSSTTSSEYGSFKSPTESVADGIEIEYTYSPTYRKTGEGIPAHNIRTMAWGSNGENLCLFNWGTISYFAWTTNTFLSAVGDDILITGSSRWNGLHKVKDISLIGAGVLILETKFNTASATMEIIGDFEADDDSLTATTAYDEELNHFKANQIVTGGQKYVYIYNADATATNSGLFKVNTDTDNGKLTFSHHIQKSAEASSDEGTEWSIIAPGGTGWGGITDGSTDTINIFDAVFESNMYVNKVDVLSDESDDLDINGYQSKAIVYYLKAKMAEDKMDIKSREFFMREFKRQIEKDISSKKRGPSIVQGNSIMRQK